MHTVDIYVTEFVEISSAIYFGKITKYVCFYFSLYLSQSIILRMVKVSIKIRV